MARVDDSVRPAAVEKKSIRAASSGQDARWRAAVGGPGLGDDLEDAAACAGEGARDRVDGEAAGAKLKDAYAARRWVGDLEAIAAEDPGERTGREVPD